MKSLTTFLQILVQELGERCHASTVMDLKTIHARSEHEGLSFITITLPAFGKDLQRALATEQITHDQFPGFSRAGGLPRFLGGFLELVFDRTSGRLLDSPSVDAILALHQITSVLAKVNVPCSPERTDAAIDAYVKCEQELRVSDRAFTGPKRDQFERIGRLLWADVFARVDLKVYEGSILPKHGPGATADRLRGNAKYRQTQWTQRLESIFPHGEMLFPSWRHYDPTAVAILEPGAERPVRVITVPKTLKTPRIIAIEPTCMQYVQQGILEALIESLQRDNLLWTLIGWESQEPNNLLAQQGSIDGTLATLDLSEASDRVSNQHVRALLANHPWLSQGVDACRSRKADVPGHGVIRLAKFASMGSALCFPFEAMVFLTIVLCGIEDVLSRRVTRKDVQSLRGRVRVYGDDIIVPVEFAESVSDSLASFGMRVNTGKSFWTGRFRESCGGDFYDGRRITPIRVREVFPTELKHAERVASTVATRNLFFREGYVDVVEYLDRLLEGVLPYYPEVYPTSPALGRHTWGVPTPQKMHATLHKPMVKAYVVRSAPRDSRLEGYGALMKYFLKRSDLPFADREHLLHAGRSVAVDIKPQWTSIR